MDYLQKIVVLCVVVGLLVAAFFVGSYYQQGRALTDSDTATKQIDPPSIELDAEPSIDDTDESPQPPAPDSPEPKPEAETELPKVVIHSFEECVALGYPVSRSIPPICYADGETFTQVIEEEMVPEIPGTLCTEEQKKVEECTMEYAPVCGYVEVQCITTPCHPVPETFSNMCSACRQGNVLSYTEGACEE